jgi:hypothetical protein
VDHPEEVEAELSALDEPASPARHPAVFGALGRSRACGFATFADNPVASALIGAAFRGVRPLTPAARGRVRARGPSGATDLTRVAP